MPNILNKYPCPAVPPSILINCGLGPIAKYCPGSISWAKQHCGGLPITITGYSLPLLSFILVLAAFKQPVTPETDEGLKFCWNKNLLKAFVVSSAVLRLV